MIKFNTYRLLNESLGMYSLGLTPVQNLGIQSNMPGYGEAGMPPQFGKKKPPFGGGEDDAEGGAMPPMGGDEAGGEGPPMGLDGGEGEEGPPMGDELGGDELGDELGGEGEEGPVDVHAKIAELEAELEKLKAMVGGEEDGLDDLDADLDHDDDLGELGDEGEEGGEEDGEEGGFPPKGDEEEDGRPPFGKNKVTPFMKKMKEGKGSFKKEDKDGKLVGKGGKDGPVFMMKKKCGSGMEDPKGKVILGKSKKMSDADDQGMLPMKKGIKKHCSDGKTCKKCDAKMKNKMHKEATGYERPKNMDNSERAWLDSIRKQLADTSVRQKFLDGTDGLQEDMLIAPPANGGLEAMPSIHQPQFGAAYQQPAYQQPNEDDLFTAEAVQDILDRLKRLEGHR